MKLRKILALFLSLAMILGTMSTVSFAENAVKGITHDKTTDNIKYIDKNFLFI